MRLAQQGREVAVVRLPLRGVEGVEPPALLGGGFLGQDEAEVAGDVADAGVEEGVPLDEVLARGADRRGGALAFRLPAGGKFPEAGQPDLGEEVLVQGERGPYWVERVLVLRVSASSAERSA